MKGLGGSGETSMPTANLFEGQILNTMVDDDDSEDGPETGSSKQVAKQKDLNILLNAKLSKLRADKTPKNT